MSDREQQVHPERSAPDEMGAPGLRNRGADRTQRRRVLDAVVPRYFPGHTTGDDSGMPNVHVNAIITRDMRAVVQSAHLCFAATVTPDGRPNLSPKGTIRVWDDSHLFFLDIASPTTRANLERSPWIEINVVDQLSRRGYRFLGRAQLHVDDDVYAEATRRVFAQEGSKYPVAAVVLVAVERALPLFSPGYMHIADEASMRATWHERRRELDDEFEQYLHTTLPMNPHESAEPR